MVGREPLPDAETAPDALRILQVVASYYPAVRYGGTIVSVHGLAAALAARLAAAAPLALRGMKANFVAAERLGFSDFLDIETERHTRITASEDCIEAFRAFVEKRPANFQGR